MKSMNLRMLMGVEEPWGLNERRSIVLILIGLGKMNS